MQAISVMFQRQLVVCLFMGFQFNTLNTILNAFPLSEETESSGELYTDFTQNTESESIGETEVDLSHLHSSYYGVPDESMHDRLLKAQREAEQMGRDFNPEEYGTYLEGDLLKPVDENKIFFRASGIEPTPKATLWPNGIVPYKLSPGFSFYEKFKIHLAMEQYHQHTCIRFRKQTVERDYIFISHKEAGCFSEVGRSGGRQIVNLQQPFCLYKIGTIMHELMHVLGFTHEQSRYDRDEYVKIIWDNIIPYMRHNFNRISRKEYSYGFVYDYNSVMHYSAYGFAIAPRKVTILALEPQKAKLMGQREGFSPEDINKIIIRYRCKFMEAEHHREDDVGLFFEFHSGNVSIDIDYNADEIDY